VISGLIGRPFVATDNVTNQRVSALQRLGFRLIYSPAANRVAVVLSTIGICARLHAGPQPVPPLSRGSTVARVDAMISPGPAQTFPTRYCGCDRRHHSQAYMPTTHARFGSAHCRGTFRSLLNLVFWSGFRDHVLTERRGNASQWPIRRRSDCRCLQEE